MGVVSQVSSRVLPFQIPLKASFPPEHLLGSRPLTRLTVEELEARTQRLAKLENLYHKGQELAWDGREVLDSLVEKHGGVDLPREKREAIGQIFTIIMWGELAAWEVSSYLAEHLRDNTEVKMAATIQTFDEARHYYVMRDYLKLLDIELPEMNGFVKSILSQVIATDSFSTSSSGCSSSSSTWPSTSSAPCRRPGSSPCWPTCSRTSTGTRPATWPWARLHLPDLLAKLSRREAIELQLYQVWLMAFMQLSIEYHREHAETLGIDIQSTLRRALVDQTEMLEAIADHPRVRGLILLPRSMRFANRWIIDAFFTSEENREQGRKGLLDGRAAAKARRTFVHGAERAWRAVA